MFLESIKLENIRSYTALGLDFPRGSLLLAGDIGSGKSTILLATEFALFGTKKKELSTTSLLRNGKAKGSVELKFNIDGKTITIKRTLKRTKDDIKQESGYIIIDGRKKELMPTELRAEVFEILGYPKALVSRTKDMIYRYTVYTPQEEMKEILTAEKDARLDTLRRVFGIDKYKRIKENSGILTRALREIMSINETRISDFEEKTNQKREREHDIKELELKIDELKPSLLETKKKISMKKQVMLDSEKKIKEINNLKKEFEIKEAELIIKLEQREINKKETDIIERHLSQIKKELEGKKFVQLMEIKEKISEKENNIDFMGKTLNEINKKINTFEAKKQSSAEIIKKIPKLEKCPLCQQDVTEEHKKAVTMQEKENIKNYDSEIEIHSEQKKEAEQKTSDLKKELEILRKAHDETALLKSRFDILNEKALRKQELLATHEKIKNDIGSINAKKLELGEKIKLAGDIEKSYQELRKDIEKELENERKIELDLNSIEKDRQSLAKIINELDKDIQEKKKIREKLNTQKQLKNWVDEYFVVLMDIIEKNIMLKVYHEFNELFQNWFNILIEDETISVRLDDEFTPLINQNGYETSVENLSGGEKTAVALAYRLSLNRVINDVVGEIKTKDIIMLDEPTDGFSTEQLDKMRTVLDELNMKQVIIVSHESKIESFVDNVIRIRKEEHVSMVV